MDLDRLAKKLDGHILLCYCSKDEMCHRVLLALILHNELGVELEEIGGFSDKLFLYPFTEVGNPILFTPTMEQIEKYDLADFLEDGHIIDKWKALNEKEKLQFYYESLS